MHTNTPLLVLAVAMSTFFTQNSAEETVYKTKTTTITQTKYLPYTAEATPAAQPTNSFVDQHNHYRALHGSNPLIWNDTMHEQCLDFIDREFICDGNIHHSQQAIDGSIGEIVTVGVSSVDEFMKNVYGTHESFDFENYTDIDETQAKMFKQLVWNDTQHFGCAVVDCGSHFRNLIVCQYDKKPDSVATKENFFPKM